MPPPALSPLDRTTQSRVRADCLAGGRNAARPCVWLTCRHNLAAEGSTTESCVLDVADRAAAIDVVTCDEVGQLLGGVSRERVRQVEAQALGKLARKPGKAYAKLRQMGEP